MTNTMTPTNTTANTNIMKNTRRWLMCVLLALPVLSFGQADDDDGGPDRSGDERVTMAVAQVPPEVMVVARNAGPDVFFDSAMSYWEDDFRVYRVSGRLFREVWNVYVRSDGVLLRTESDTQD